MKQYVKFASMDGNAINYLVAIYRGHVFRIENDGRITKADAADKVAARRFGLI